MMKIICGDCGGPCKGHPVTCPHDPGAGKCAHCKLHDSDETSAQAKEAKKRGTRRYSHEWTKVAP